MGLEDDGTKSVEQLWEEWKVENGRKYDTPEEEKKRFGIFKDNKKRIDEHNEKFKKGEVSFSQGLTLWADIKQASLIQLKYKPASAQPQPS
ncbi:Cysteine peptidase inhibitor domain 1 [Frankliniella occidentalis]|nr:Cysteine peptidase inhibitor domain 1 [Frankliniella occidentalis]